LLQLYTFRHAHTDGRISNPLLFIFSSPSGKNLKNNQNKNKNKILKISSVSQIQSYTYTATGIDLLNYSREKEGIFILFFSKSIPIILNRDYSTIHRKKAFQYSRPKPGCHLPNSPWAGIINLFPPSSVSDIPAGDGNIEKLFLRFYGLENP
jgi:hypothetical protein